MHSISHTLQQPGTCSSSSGRLARLCHRQQRAVSAVVARSDKGKQLINEDVLARLQAAEAEAARLRQELAAAQAAKGGPAVDVIEAQPKRIDSTDKRETLDFGNPQPRAAWLTEADVNFFIGAGTGEQPTAADADSTTPEEKATVQRRLLIGGALTVGALAFGMIPTEKLRLRPSKPMFFYIVPLLRVQSLLAECKPLIEDADWEALRFALARIKGNPNNVRDNLSSAVAWIDDAGTAERANKLSLELFEYLESMDYNKYYEAMPTKVIGPAQNMQFVEFSGKALQAAQAKLQAFLALLPSDQLEAARTQLAQFSY